MRTEAVRDAVNRAQQYADALGLGTVMPAAIADAGMLSANLHPDAGPGMARMHVMAGLDGMPPEDIELIPEDIAVHATVDARFLADVRR